MTRREAIKFLKISAGPKDWADENSEFHRDNIASFKEEFIETWLEAKEIVDKSDVNSLNDRIAEIESFLCM